MGILYYGVLVLQVPYTASVQDVCFVRGGHQLVVALRDSNYLRIINMEDMEVGGREGDSGSGGGCSGGWWWSLV